MSDISPKAADRVAVIPARGGSKRIPRKNVKPFCGKPMIAWSIEAALASGCFDRVIVSTDDDAIADVAREWGAEVPFRRPEALADDHTGTVPVIAHALDWLEAHGDTPRQVCCVYATAPFVQADDLRRGLAILEAEGADYVFSVTSYAFPIQRALRLTAEGRVAMFQPEHAQTRSQDLEEAFHDAGQFYWGRAEAWRQALPLMGPGAAPAMLPRHRVQDIDTPEDWQRAEWLFRSLQAEDA
ncbi:pseudaminic acid cytidylyltransferase [Halomonas saccharevitans]|uniref:N-acylneuraminate cytidylyltransferase n=1 Tax=Halomonas saccharevitans TaxID=416872 RepID=A0A1I7B3Z4_9GAMM|nr:pseudaminic acid cytidylyltransferase [Halomonas saccharevitans]SFT81916.1 N-acylneuraminate cytidylyltransferase [Halomonas saccharevitans]